MQLHKLPTIVNKKAKRLGRGTGSGKGKTAGRGIKGQKARSKVKVGFEGGQLKLIKRLPFVRGRGFKARTPKPDSLDLSQLNSLPSGSKITPRSLQEAGLIKNIPAAGIKLLSKGKLEKKLHFEGFQLSRGAKKQIESLGGKIK